MFVVFEGIDGSGKTTISNRVARRLQARGVELCHLRQDGKFASNVTEAVRSLARDARNMALVPEAELLLYAARELQLVEEVLRPALRDGKLVVADRYFYTAEVLGRFGRGLDASWVSCVLELARRRLTPELVVLIDVDPVLARARRKAAKLDEPTNKPPSRKGLAGAGLAQRLRQGYLELARAEPGRFAVIDNDAELEDTVARVEQLILTSLARGVAAALDELRSAEMGRADPLPELRSLPDTVEQFLRRVGGRAASEPGVAAFLLSGFHGPRVDGVREALAARAPRVVLHALTTLTDDVSFELRARLAKPYPAEVAGSLLGVSNDVVRALELRAQLCEPAGAAVAMSLQGLSDAASFELRHQLEEHHPHAVMQSLSGVEDARAWPLRERYLDHRRAELAESLELASGVMRSVRGSSDERAWQLRDRCWAASPVAVLKSMANVDDERSWRLRHEHLERAPRPVLESLGQLRTERAWSLRSAAASKAKEALDGIAGADDTQAWALRELYADLWPSTVVKSMGLLWSCPRGKALLERQLVRHGHLLGVQRNASLLALSLAHPHPALED